MPRRLAVLVSTLAAALAAQGALAADDDFIRKGLYVSFGGNYGWDVLVGQNLNESLALVPPNDIDVTGSWGMNLRGGYRWCPYFATELQVEHLLSFSIFNDKFITATANMKFIAPFQYLQPYALFGLGPSYAKLVDDTSIALRFGGGLDYALGRHWSVNVEMTYVMPFNEGVVDNEALQAMATPPGTLTLDELDYVALNFGFSYRF